MFTPTYCRKPFVERTDELCLSDRQPPVLEKNRYESSLVAQLESADTIQQRRQAVWERYRAELGDWAGSRGIELPCVPAEAERGVQVQRARPGQHRQRGPRPPLPADRRRPHG